MRHQPATHRGDGREPEVLACLWRAAPRWCMPHVCSGCLLTLHALYMHICCHPEILRVPLSGPERAASLAHAPSCWARAFATGCLAIVSWWPRHRPWHELAMHVYARVLPCRALTGPCQCPGLLVACLRLCGLALTCLRPGQPGSPKGHSGSATPHPPQPLPVHPGALPQPSCTYQRLPSVQARAFAHILVTSMSEYARSPPP